MLCSHSRTEQVAAAVAAGAVGAIGNGQRGSVASRQGEDPPLACLNVALTKGMLKLDVCALSTDVVYNRWDIVSCRGILLVRPNFAVLCAFWSVFMCLLPRTHH